MKIRVISTVLALVLVAGWAGCELVTKVNGERLPASADAAVGDTTVSGDVATPTGDVASGDQAGDSADESADSSDDGPATAGD